MSFILSIGAWAGDDPTINGDLRSNIQSVDQIDIKQWQENDIYFGLAVSANS